MGLADLGFEAGDACAGCRSCAVDACNYAKVETVGEFYKVGVVGYGVVDVLHISAALY